MRSDEAYVWSRVTETAAGVNCGVPEWARSAPRWYGRVSGMPEEKMVERAYHSNVRGDTGRDRPYMSGKNKIKSKWRSFCHDCFFSRELPGGTGHRTGIRDKGKYVEK